MRVRDWARRHGLTVALFLGLWTVIGLSFASQFYLSSSALGYYFTWGQAIGITLSDWYVWAALSPGIIWFARRFPLHRRNWSKLLVIHTAASAVTSLTYILVRAALGQWQGQWLGLTTSFGDTLAKLLVKNSLFNILIYWIIVTVSLAFDYYRKFHEREWRTAELERGLAEAKLMALQMQLNRGVVMLYGSQFLV